MTIRQRRASEPWTSSACERLLDAAAELLRTGGPQAATSRAITDAAGENLGAITYYFGSKDRLVAEAMVAVARTLIAPIVAQLANRDTDPIQNLLGSPQMLYRLFDENRHQLPGYLHTLAVAATNEDVRHEIQALHRSLAAVLTQSISEQQNAGSLPDWITPEPMAQLIVATVNGIIVAAATDPDRRSSRRGAIRATPPRLTPNADPLSPWHSSSAGSTGPVIGP